MEHYGEAVFTVGETYEDEYVRGVEAGGSSWILPVTEKDRLYVYRYRLWREPGLEQSTEMEVAL